MTRVFPRSKQFFLLYVLIGSRWNFPYYAIGCRDYFAFVFRTFNQKDLQNTASHFRCERIRILLRKEECFSAFANRCISHVGG